jgi:aromatic-L-amino-acid/L-tryptophan decarboxylase
MSDLGDLEYSADEMRRMADAVVERVVRHIASLGEQPAVGDMARAEELAAALDPTIPESGQDLEGLLAPLFDEWIPATFNSAGPGYLAFVPGGGLFPAALADFIADGVNRYTGVYNASPALVQLEANVLDWFRQWMGMPESTRGLLTTGGSMATLSAVVCARHRLLGSDLRDGVLYTSSQAHHCVAKAAQLAGILPDRQRVLDADDHFRVRPAALREAIARDRRAGLRPFLVVSSAGTTNTGAVDPIDAIADICQAESLWHHCDGAYGGFFHMLPEMHDTLAGLPRVDSLTLDPHKGLFLPYGTGALLVRDGEALRQAHAAHAGYLPPLADGRYDPAQYGPELSRPFRGLRVWLPMMLYGAEKLRAALAEKVELARWCADELAGDPRIELVERPRLSLLAFRFRPSPGASEAETDEATKRLLERVNARGRVFLTGAQVGERFYGRVCVLCFRTRRAHMDHAMEDLRAAMGA